MENNFRRQAWNLYYEMYLEGNKIFARGKEMCNQKNYREGLPLMDRSLEISTLCSVTLCVAFGLYESAFALIPQKAESLH